MQRILIPRILKKIKIHNVDLNTNAGSRVYYNGTMYCVQYTLEKQYTAKQVMIYV